MRWESDNQSLPRSGYLEHHGILGQKWGVRRFQNTDGTLTLAGKERYGSQTKDREDSITKENVWDKLQENYNLYVRSYKDESAANNKYEEVSYKEYSNAEKEVSRLIKKNQQRPNSTLNKYGLAVKEYDEAKKSNASKEELDRLHKRCKVLIDEGMKEDLFILYQYVKNNYPKQKVPTLLAMLYASDYHPESE